MLFLPYIQENYNLTRLYLQLFSILTISSITGFWFVVRKNIRFGLPIIGITIALIFITKNGFLDQFIGGQLRITMTQPSGTFDTYYIYDEEVDAAKWLSQNRDIRFPVYADSVANLRLQSFANIDAKDTLFPAAIQTDGYVYSIKANIAREHAFYSFDNNTLVYSYPSQFLEQNKNLIYSSGSSKVYK